MLICWKSSYHIFVARNYSPGNSKEYCCIVLQPGNSLVTLHWVDRSPSCPSVKRCRRWGKPKTKNLSRASCLGVLPESIGSVRLLLVDDPSQPFFTFAAGNCTPNHLIRLRNRNVTREMEVVWWQTGVCFQRVYGLPSTNESTETRCRISTASAYFGQGWEREAQKNEHI